MNFFMAGGVKMQNVKANIREKLPYEIQRIALNFIDALVEYGVTFYKDNNIVLPK